MGSYSCVQLFLHPGDVEKYRELIEKVSIPDDEDPSQLDSAGRPKGVVLGDRPSHARITWYEVRWGSGNAEFEELIAALDKDRIPYRFIDEGCPGEWSGEEWTSNGHQRRYRPWADTLGPVLTKEIINQWAKDGKDLETTIKEYFAEWP